MNDAILKLEAGDLTGAVEAALALVKSNPTNETARTFLFELSCFSGDWERAVKQLDVIGHQDVNAAIGSLIFKQNFAAERARLDLYEKGTKPEVVMSMPHYVEDLLKANDLLREGKAFEARSMFDDIEDRRPAFKCKVNGESYEDIRDYNDPTMCVFELIVKDQFVWLPFEQVNSIKFLERKSLRDVYWLQAEVDMKSGMQGEMFLPSLYSGTAKSSDDQIRLGRAVDWRDMGEEVYVGEGARLYSLGGKDLSILDIKTIEFEDA